MSTYKVEFTAGSVKATRNVQADSSKIKGAAGKLDIKTKRELKTILADEYHVDVSEVELRAVRLGSEVWQKKEEIATT